MPLLISRGEYQPSSDLYESDIVGAIANCIGTNCGKLKPQLVRHDAKGLTVRDDYLARLLSLRWSPEMTPYDALYKMASDLVYRSNAFAVIFYNDDFTKVKSINPITTTSHRIWDDEKGNTFFKFTWDYDGKEYTVPYQAVIHLKSRYNKKRFLGTPPDTQLKTSLELLDVTAESLRNVVRQSANLKGYLKYNNFIDEDELREKVVNFQKAYMDASNEGGLGGLDSSTDFHEINQKTQTIPTVQSQFLRENIYRYYNCNDKILMSLFDEAEWNAFYEAVIEPIAIQLSLECTFKLLSERERGCGNKIVFTADRLQCASLQTRTNIGAQLFDRGIITINEYRELLYYEPIEDGDVLKERAEKVEIGETRTNLTKQITAESKEQADRIIKTATFSEKLEASLKQRIADATAAITGNSGGYVVLYPPENPQEIFVMDSPDTKTAKNVWRWNKAGLGHSSNGVNGPFNVAIQQDGTIIADFIGAGELDGMLIKAGMVKAESLSVEYKQSVTTKAQELANTAEDNANTATDEKLKNYSTTTEMQSALTVEAGKISAKVSETYETKENATQKMTDANNALESYKREASAAIELNADAIKSKVTADEVTSQIEQSAEAIRCQAKKISWKSENSEMTEDGKLSCQGAEISGTFKQVHGGKKSIDINNNEVKVFSWQNTGNFAGALGSVYVKNTGRDKVALWCDNNDIVSIGCQQEEGDTPNANIDAVIQIDAKTYKEQTPWIRNTASGKLFPENKEGVTVENGLIKGWDIEYASGTMSLISGLSWNNTGITKVERCNITIKNGIITGWDTTSKNY